MRTSWRAVRAGVVVVLAAGLLGPSLAACSGDSGGSDATPATYPAAWSAAERRRVERIAARIASARPGACEQVGFVDPVRLAPAVERFRWTAVPGALADCSFNEDQTIEIGVFDSDATRDRFIDERTRSICRRAASIQSEVPPFAWVRGDRTTVQADTTAIARRVADALDARTDVRRCDLSDTLGWRRAAAARVRGIGGRFVASAPCGALGLVDRETFAGDAGDAEVPAAVASCVLIDRSGASGPTGASGTVQDGSEPTVYIAAFDRRSETRAEFVQSVLGDAGLCRDPHTVVLGEGWALVTPTRGVPAIVAATGGRAGQSCGAPTGP